jgi:hypothetical protein
MKKNMQGITIWRLNNLIEHSKENFVNVDKGWIPCRPLGCFGFRYKLKAILMVLRGEADVVIWPKIC